MKSRGIDLLATAASLFAGLVACRGDADVKRPSRSTMPADAAVADGTIAPVIAVAAGDPDAATASVDAAPIARNIVRLVYRGKEFRHGPGGWVLVRVTLVDRAGRRMNVGKGNRNPVGPTRTDRPPDAWMQVRDGMELDRIDEIEDGIPDGAYSIETSAPFECGRASISVPVAKDTDIVCRRIK